LDKWLIGADDDVMTQRKLGALATPAIGLGCMGLSQGYGPAQESVAEAVHAALDAGIVLFDTAMSYGMGHNESVLGAALSDVDTEVQVASKVGITRDDGGVRLDAAPERIRGYCEASLRRLGREHLDLYYLHRVDPAYPIEEQIGALAELVTAGLVRHLGVSEVSADQLRRACATAPIAAVQLEWSLAWRAPEDDVVPAARELGVGLVAYSPLGRGLLTGAAESRDPATSAFRRTDPRFTADALSSNTKQTETIAAIADRLGATPGQVALAWLLVQGDDVVAIPGSRRPQRIRENAGAARLTLDDRTLAELAAVSAGFVGDRTSFAVERTRRAGA
jgi:aryl-alcohol dehydrogenase-like predicted oxidoreductase